jgi:HEAT repeat protein
MLSIMLDTAFDALKKFDWGSDLAALSPIDDAVTGTHDKPDARRELENRLISALNGELTRDARDYVCRKLATIGSVASVPALAVLLPQAESSHMARFALERMAVPEAGTALRDSLSKVAGSQKLGVISSLGARGESTAVEPLSALLTDANTARAAALALGAIGSVESANALQKSLDNPNVNQSAVIDALLSCAESLLASDKRADAFSIYKRFSDRGQSRIVRLAATRGLLACTNKQA